MSVRLYTALAALALLVPTLVVAPAALATESPDAPLAVFRPGAPDEPTWRMLKLDVTEEADLRFDVDFIHLRCPTLMQFSILRGEPGNAKVRVGLTFDFGGGDTGTRIDTEGPVDVELSALTHEGADACSMGEISFRFIDVPAEPVYLLHATGGLPSQAVITLGVDEGAATVIDESWGYGSHYLTADDFDNVAHVGVWSPGACMVPNTDPAAGFCEPGAWIPGGFMGGAEAGAVRHAEIVFAHRPWFTLDIISTGVGNASVTDSEGLVRYLRGSVARVGPVEVLPLGAAIGTSFPYDYPSGSYSFDILVSASVGAPFLSRPHWKLFAIDHWFPEEQP